MSPYAIAAGLVLLWAAWLIVRTFETGVIRPMPALLLVTGSTLLANGLGLLRIHPVSWHAAAVVLLMTAATVGAYCGAVRARVHPEAVARLRRISTRRLGLRASQWTGIGLTMLTLVGVIAFRMSIANAAGLPYSSLSLSQVRYIQVYQAESLSLPSSLLLLGPVAAAVNFVCWGSLLARILGLVMPLCLTFLTPSRTLALNSLLVVTVFVLGLGASGRIEGLPGVPVSRRVIWIFAAIGGIFVTAVVVANFVLVGAGLNKLPSHTGVSNLPAPVESLLIYTVAPWSAFSDALAGAPGAPGAEGVSRVFWLFHKAASLVHLVPSEAATPASYVNIPIPFNTFTWIGDLQLSVGPVLAMLCCVFVGGTFGLVERLMRGRPPFWVVWANAVLVAVALNCFSGFRLFVLDTVVLMLVGAAALSVIQPSSGRRGEHVAMNES